MNIMENKLQNQETNVFEQIPDYLIKGTRESQEQQYRVSMSIDGYNNFQFSMSTFEPFNINKNQHVIVEEDGNQIFLRYG